MQANATFDIQSADRTPYDDHDGARLMRGRVTKTYRGDVQGQGTAELLMAETPGGPAAYAAQERFTGAVHGRRGSFVTQYGAVSGTTPGADTDAEITWTVVPGSGTGELAGIRGHGNLVVSADGRHDFCLDYELT
jgi:hypothetical protein